MCVPSWLSDLFTYSIIHISFKDKNMKTQGIYTLLQVALILLLAACTREEFPAIQNKVQQLTISITDGGYASVVDNKTTRAVENVYTTAFTENQTFV